MKLFREKGGSRATQPPVLITESNDIERLKSIARNTAAFDLGVQDVEWETDRLDEMGCMRLRLSDDFYFVIRP
ncbi:MAG: hypothetical protein MI745_03580 [Pseudomonadales bacterium]|nr:hypothetical protein [Pseudomonadales bacterium]